jgi:4-hydroxybenzoate polyprenyltransferase
MIKQSTFLHLRIPFSFFLLPVFVFALSQNENYSIEAALMIFIILHFFLYPASNGYNSYFDKDEESIGGLEKPPPVTNELYFASLVLDLIALLLGLFFVNFPFVVMIFIYGLVSKAYSHPSVRLKKYPFISWVAAGIFQGYFTFMATEVGLSGLQAFNDFRFHAGGLLCSVLLMGSYPMTQVYQHKEDRKRGDITLSVVLGIRGTFIFTAIVFVVAMAGFTFFFEKYYDLGIALAFQGFLLPVLIYFLLWFAKVWFNEGSANFRSTMRLNFISSLCMNLYFLFLIFYHYLR